MFEDLLREMRAWGGGPGKARRAMRLQCKPGPEQNREEEKVG